MKQSLIKFTQHLSSKKLEKRANRFLETMVQHQSVSINKISGKWSEAMGNYRMIENEKVNSRSIKAAIVEACGQIADCGHALLIQDTTQPNYEKHRGRIKPQSGLGVIGDNKSLGYFLHPTLVIDAKKGICYGFSDIITWTRDPNREVVEQEWKQREKRKNQPIEEKESYRWIDSINESKKKLPGCNMLTCISDREGDIYELFASVPDERTHVLIRSRDNRTLEEGKLFEYLEQQPLCGEYEIAVRGDIRTGRKKRMAKIEVKYSKVTLLRPQNRNNKKYSESVELYAIEAKEKGETVPDGEEPIHWRLLTTHKIESFKQAIIAIVWYSMRWFIEQLFRVLKNDGLNIEASELGYGENIIKIGLFALGAALRVMQLLLASKGGYTQPIEQVFTGEEQELLDIVTQQYEGKTEKQKNPHKPGTLEWAAWIIARIGGWKGYQSQRCPGPITFFEGLKQFNFMFDGWILAKNFVYKQ